MNPKVFTFLRFPVVSLKKKTYTERFFEKNQGYFKYKNSYCKAVKQYCLGLQKGKSNKDNRNASV